MVGQLDGHIFFSEAWSFLTPVHQLAQPPASVVLLA